MARTMYGNLTGRAAVVELRDYRAWVEESCLRERREAQDVYYDALRNLQLNDPNWEQWFDDARNVPEYIHWKPSVVEPIVYRMNTRAMQKQMMQEMPHLLSR